MTKKFTGLRIEPGAQRSLKLLSVKHGVAMGDMIAALVTLAEAGAIHPDPAFRREFMRMFGGALALADSEEGELVPEGEPIADHLKRLAAEREQRDEEE